MELTPLDEFVKVRADFSGGAITPVCFRRGHAVFLVQGVHGSWMRRDGEGGGAEHCFAVSVSSGDVYRLSFRTRDLLWKLEAVQV